MGGETGARRLVDGLTGFLDDIASNRPAAMTTDGGEALHDLRVGVRRTRSLLKNAKGAIARKKRDKFLHEFAWLQEMTGPARDYEVWMAAVEPGDPLRLVLAGHYEHARREAVAALESRRTTRLIEKWRAALRTMPDGDEFDPEARIARQRRRVLDAAHRATPDAAAARLHELRKRVKELRYLLDLFGTDEQRSLRRTLKRLQDSLGAVQDVAVQREWLLGHAGELGAVDVRVKELDERDAAARSACATDITQYLAEAS